MYKNGEKITKTITQNGIQFDNLNDGIVDFMLSFLALYFLPPFYVIILVLIFPFHYTYRNDITVKLLECIVYIVLYV
jgi:hypothetical protein